MTETPIGALIESLISNPRVDTKKDDDLILPVIFLDRKAPQHMDTGSMVQVGGNPPEDGADGWKREIVAADCGNREREFFE